MEAARQIAALKKENEKLREENRNIKEQILDLKQYADKQKGKPNGTKTRK